MYIKITLLLLLAFFTSVHLLSQGSGRIDNMAFSVGEFVLLLGLLFLIQKQFALKSKPNHLPAHVDVGLSEATEHEEKKRLLQRSIVLFPFILIIPGALHAWCWFNCADWGGLGSLVLLIESAFAVGLLEVVLIVQYIWRFSEKRGSQETHVSMDGVSEVPISTSIDFIDKILIFFTCAYFIGYLSTFSGNAFLSTTSLLAILVYVIFLFALKRGKTKIAQIVLTIVPIVSVACVIFVINNFSYLFGSSEGSRDIVDFAEGITIFFGYALNIVTYYRLRLYCGPHGTRAQIVLLVITMITIVGMVAMSMASNSARSAATQLSLEVYLKPFPPLTSSHANDWNIYANEEAKYSIHYPTDWSVRIATDTDAAIVFLENPKSRTNHDTPHNFRIAHYANISVFMERMKYDYLTFDEMVRGEQQKMIDDGHPDMAMHPIDFAGQKGYAGWNGECNKYQSRCFVVWVEKDSHFYEVADLFSDNRLQISGYSDNEQILGSFQFGDASSRVLKSPIPSAVDGPFPPTPSATMTIAIPPVAIAMTNPKSSTDIVPLVQTTKDHEKEFGFQIMYPRGWSEEGHPGDQQYMFFNYPGPSAPLPPAEGSMRVEIYRGCNLYNSNPVTPTRDGGSQGIAIRAVSKTVCKDGFQFILLLRSDDKHFAERVALFDEMVKSFKSTR